MDLFMAALLGGAAYYTALTLVPAVLPASIINSPIQRSLTLGAIGILGGYGLHKLGQSTAGAAVAAVFGGSALVGGLASYMQANKAPAGQAAAPGQFQPSALGAIELGNERLMGMAPRSSWAGLGAVELGNSWQLGAVELGAPDWGYENMRRAAEGGVDWGYAQPFSLGAIEAQMMDADMGY
jgi:hypothetical protein